MLFDLRGKGRRRTVRVVYVGLALLIGVGLVGFGIGTGGSGGGLLNAASKNEGSGGVSYADEVKRYEKLVRAAAEGISSKNRDTLRKMVVDEYEKPVRLRP